MDSIIARGLTFKAYHGLYEHETQQGQEFRVDLRFLQSSPKRDRATRLKTP